MSMIPAAQKALRLGSAVLAEIGDVIAGRPDIAPELDPLVRPSMAGMGPDAGDSAFDRLFRWVRVPTDRRREMLYYDYLEREIPDVKRALDAITTMAVTGNLAGGGSGSYSIQLDDPENIPADLKERLANVNRIIQANAYTITRAMTKYGSFFPQITIDQRPDGKPTITGLRHIPPATIYRNIGNNGQSDAARYYYQMVQGKIFPTTNTLDQQGLYTSGIPRWVLPHFAVWSNVVTADEVLLYGTSILQPVGAIALKLHACLDATVVARLSRAAMRYAWKVDCSDIKTNQTAMRARLGEWQRLLSRSTNLLGSTQTDSFQRTPIPDQDFYIPAAEGLNWGLDKIDGDTNLSRVGDIDMLAQFYFGAIGVPPEYLGHQRSQGGRSNMSQLDISFARNCRHIQLFGAAAFQHMVMVEMVLGGYDPTKYRVTVNPPSIGARDDLLQAQIKALQAQVLSALVLAGLDPTVAPRWVMETFLGLDEELAGLDAAIIDKLFKAADLTKPPGGPDKPPTSQQKKVIEALLQTNGDAIELVRANLRFLAAGRDSIAGNLYNHGQPTAEEMKQLVLGSAA